MDKCRVLIVDDIPENVQTLKDMIEDMGIDIKEANGGKEAMELVDSYKPQIIFLDLMMPAVNGWDVIEHVRKDYKKTEMAIVGTSLLNNKDNIDECYELGVNDYIAKPLIKARVRSSLESHMLNIRRTASELVG